MPDLETLQTRLEYQFKDPLLLQLALTHPSLCFESPGPSQHNQRLEFLGDAVLSLVLSGALYEKFPQSSEGALTKARAHLVNRRTLATHSRKLNLGDYLILSRGEEISGGRQRPSSLADAFEAVVGAIFQDGGYEAAHRFVWRRFADAFDQLEVIPNVDNPKGELQEWLQARSSEAPRYEITSTEGPDHDRLFECAVLYQGKELGRGRGKSKKSAESQAAWAALRHLRQVSAPFPDAADPAGEQEQE